MKKPPKFRLAKFRDVSSRKCPECLAKSTIYKPTPKTLIIVKCSYGMADDGGRTRADVQHIIQGLQLKFPSSGLYAWQDDIREVTSSYELHQPYAFAPTDKLLIFVTYHPLALNAERIFIVTNPYFDNGEEERYLRTIKKVSIVVVR